VRSSIVLCRELGLSVVAEGVETASELEWLQVNRCDLAQGFGIGRPMPVHELYGWLAITHAGLTGTVAGRPALPVESDSKTV
jgi:EAL domain-containing protein (putative c-di-GMP-specific phosphodiesterase class I)